MKVLLIPQFSETGGTRDSFLEILDVHIRQTIETFLLLPPNCDNKMIGYIKKKKIPFSIRPDRPIILDIYYLSTLYDFFQIMKSVRRFKPDLIVASVGTPGDLFAPFFYSSPFIYLLHTIPKKSSWKRYILFSIPRWFSNRKKRVVSVSEASCDRISRYWNIQREKIGLLYNGFSSKNVSGDSNDHVLDEVFVPPAWHVILTVGHMIEYKNPDVWLSVARKVIAERGDVSFIWLGSGKLLKKYQNLTSNDRNISFLGHKNNLRSYYANATIYFQPSRLENHSRSVLDAMANGLPCIASDAGGLPESVIDSENGYICAPDDVDGFVNRLSELLANPDLRKRLGVAGKKRANTLFHPAQFEKNLMSLYHELTSPG